MQSKILRLLSFVQMCKFFSHFGVRTLLVLYMVEALGRADSYAFGVNALFCGLNELGGIFGGILADRYLGLRKGVLLGSTILAIGYLSLSTTAHFIVPLSVIIAGSSLFSSNITALLGMAYVEHDPGRKRGFTIFYMMQNLGALLATLLCGFIAMKLSFSWGFLVASIGQWLGTAALFSYHRLLDHLDQRVLTRKNALRVFFFMMVILLLAITCLWFFSWVNLFLPMLTAAIMLFFIYRIGIQGIWSKKEVYTLLIYLSALILFFSVEDQICSSLILFAERATARTLFGWVVPSSFITAINPMIILSCGAIVAKRETGIALPFLMTAVAFGVIALLCLAQISCSILGVMGVVAFISLAELMIAPLIFAYTSEMAGKGHPGMVMGLIALAFSLSYQISGLLSQMVAMEESILSLYTYGMGFALIALIMIVGGLLVKYVLKKISYT